jgi:hypothetical protein
MFSGRVVHFKQHVCIWVLVDARVKKIEGLAFAQSILKLKKQNSNIPGTFAPI